MTAKLLWFPQLGNDKKFLLIKKEIQKHIKAQWCLLGSLGILEKTGGQQRKSSWREKAVFMRLHGHREGSIVTHCMWKTALFRGQTWKEKEKEKTYWEKNNTFCRAE